VNKKWQHIKNTPIYTKIGSNKENDHLKILKEIFQITQEISTAKHMDYKQMRVALIKNDQRHS